MSRSFGFFALLVLILALTLAGCGGKKDSAQAASAESPVQGDVQAGAEVYQSTCVACHGPDAKGVPGLGKSLHPSDSEFVRNASDEELVELIVKGRTPDHPLNTSGVGMPAKGGNPAISEKQINDVVAWIRDLD
jgi:mono/diheme cytochrome c family protein